METFFTIGLSDDSSMFQCLETPSEMIETTRGLIFDKKPHIAKSQQQNSAKIEITLEHGEEVVHKFQKIQELKYSQQGDLYLTNYKVWNTVKHNNLQIFYTGQSESPLLFCIYLSNIASYKFVQTQLGLKTKDMRKFRFQLASQEQLDQIAIYLKSRSAFIIQSLKVRRQDTTDKCVKRSDIIKNVIDDFQEMTQGSNDFVAVKSSQIVSHREQQHHMYLPEQVYVLNNVQASTIQGSGNFRLHGMFPMLTYFNKSQNIAIWRSSQPVQKQDQVLKPSKDDEAYLMAIGQRTNSQHAKKFYIFNHCSNQLVEEQKMQFESPCSYPGTKMIFYDMWDMKKIARGFEKMFQYSNKFHKSKEQKKYLSKIVKSEWFTLLNNTIDYSIVLSKAFQSKNAQSKDLRSANVLIYCRNGKLGSSVLSSLAQLLIEPRYRTLAGFKTLFYKEWIYFDHDPIKYLNLDSDEDQLSPTYAPILHLFLDCVQQLMNQNPSAFEFTEDILLSLATNCFTTKFIEFTNSSGPSIFDSSFQTNPFFQIQSDIDYKSSSLIYWHSYFSQYQPLFKHHNVDDTSPVEVQSQYYSLILQQNERMIKELRHRAAALLKDNEHMQQGKQLLRELYDLINHR